MADSLEKSSFFSSSTNSAGAPGPSWTACNGLRKVRGGGRKRREEGERRRRKRKRREERGGGREEEEVEVGEAEGKEKVLSLWGKYSQIG